MYTQCPKCRTIFEIDEAALQAALGIVRCGQCSERFDALRTLSGEVPAGTDATLPDHDPEQLTPVLTQAIAPTPARDNARPRPSGGEPLPAAEANAAAPARTPDDHSRDALPAPSMARATRALVAAVVDVPPHAVCGDPAWLVTALPQQPQLTDACITSFSPGALAATPLARDDTEGVLASRVGDVEAEARTHAELPTPTDTRDVIAIMQATASERDSAAGPAGIAIVPEDQGFDGTPGIACVLDACVPAPLLLLVHESPRVPPTDRTQVQASDAVVAEPEALPAADVAPVDADTAAEDDNVVPLYVSPRRSRVRRSSALFGLGCVVLALVLAAQIGWARRVALVSDPATHAWALGVCATLDCRLPPIRDVAKLELLSRDVRAGAGNAHALVISARLRNHAAFRQPWPIVVVRLTDLDNNVIAMRRFRPAEYVSDAARRRDGIAAGATAAVAFEVTDPGQRATGFRFSFE